MANILEDIQCVGSDTRPPMLDRTDFLSWQQRIRLYCRGKENGVNILKSIDEGPFQMGTFWETLAEGTEGALHLGKRRGVKDGPPISYGLMCNMLNPSSSVPSMTTPVIDLTKSQSDSSLPTSTATTSTITTTIILPPPPLQSTTYPILVRLIGELEQHIADLIQNNLALEERLDKHESRLYKLENLNIPHQVSKAVDEIVTDAVDWAMQAPLRARFRDLPTKSVELDYSNQRLADQEEARKKKRKTRESPRTPFGSPPTQPPPPPPPAGVSGALGSQALSLSKIAASASQFMSWTTSDTQYESADIPKAQELSPTDYLMQDDSIPDKQVLLSDDEDSENDHQPKADS
ncbi:hypothetical protein Tco_0803561 [Tanacetum coccineum]|uniref:Integrase, catalytic region, zinc finger, CCHC-type, peptidase aspartic, catalytic n=1 Tax=Tanacetum coccineum TaxID=301880 RepID=A0ABQ5A6B2_9ASTR